MKTRTHSKRRRFLHRLKGTLQRNSSPFAVLWAREDC